MARIIYKGGCEGQNKLDCIEGIEITLIDGKKALIYPKYAEKPLLKIEQYDKWDAPAETEIKALKVTNTGGNCIFLWRAGSPAVNYVWQFSSERLGTFELPSLWLL